MSTSTSRKVAFMDADSSQDLFGRMTLIGDEQEAVEELQRMASKRRVSFGPLESSVNHELFTELSAAPSTLTAAPAVSTTTIEPVVATPVVVRDVNEYTLHNFKLRDFVADHAKLVLHCPLHTTLRNVDLMAMSYEQHLDAAINGKAARSVSLGVRALLEANAMHYALYIASGKYMAFNVADWRTTGTHLDLQTFWSTKFPKVRADVARIFGPTEAAQAGVFTAASAWMTHVDSAQKVVDALLAGKLTEAQLGAMKIASYKDHNEKVPRTYGLTSSRRSSTDRWMRVVTHGASATAPAVLTLIVDSKSKSTSVAASNTAPKKKTAKKRTIEQASSKSDDEDEKWQPGASDTTTALKSTIATADLYSPTMFGDEFDPAWVQPAKAPRVEAVDGGGSGGDGALATNNLIDVLSTEADDDLLGITPNDRDQWLVNNMLSASLGLDSTPLSLIGTMLDTPEIVVVQRQPLREALVQRVLDAPAGTPLAMLALNQRARFARDGKARQCGIDVHLDSVDVNTRSVLTGIDGDLCTKWAAAVDSVIEKMILADGRLPATCGAGVTHDQFVFAARQFGYSGAQLQARRTVE